MMVVVVEVVVVVVVVVVVATSFAEPSFRYKRKAKKRPWNTSNT